MLFNPVEQERLCVITVLVNSVRVRVRTEDGQTLPVQLSALWSSAVQMDGEVYQVCVHVRVYKNKGPFPKEKLFLVPGY